MDLINIVLTGSPPKVSPGDTIWQYLQVLIDTEELPYNKKFGKMSSYYSYSSLRSRYRMKSQRKYSNPDPNQNQDQK